MNIAQTNLSLANAKNALSAAKSANPYRIEDEIAAFQEVESLERGLAYAKQVLEERF